MTNALDQLTQQLLDAARKAGADGADALAVDGTSVSIDVLHGKLEHAERSEGIDIGLRVLVGQRQACVSASDISVQTIETMAERAVAMAREAPEDAHIALACPDMLARDWDLAALELQDPTPEPDPADLERDAAEAEAAALAVKGVSQVSSSSAGYGRHQFHLATSNGFSGGYGRTHRAISTVAITGEGASMERDYSGEMRTFQSDLPSAHEVGTKAGDRTVARAGARKPPTGAFPVLYDERISSSLIGHLLSAVNGAMIARGSSWLRDALGEQVLPNGIDLIEDPHRPRISGSRPFDGEGLATQMRKIIDGGTLTGWTLDIATAGKLGLHSTANASRGTSAPPSPSISNVTLTQGDLSRDDLIKQMGTGLLVTSMIGSTINPTAGDYSRGASGFWVENGKIAYPVNECTIAGNLRDMLRRIIPANDAEAHLSRMVPSLLVEGMTIAGD
ncbi:TldD/PmbA family protein [Aliiroseovarius sp. S2029]|uniref:TldD/PmbA family protein n=1 Tax=Aliiroseovarius sp. S2029 TaxID=2936988 RepID=UPI0020C01499|nr:TldD/PmbA family protein [Aliiroseovarius sp. S2029]MCK8484317.1 TldD/PmbA family protein [Aliiroseovarius sp. S2029]